MYSLFFQRIQITMSSFHFDIDKTEQATLDIHYVVDAYL
jgi:hypothetical protein